ncbi:hypothetical protein HH310_33900 [Actinoplanes sp. TBRC 11911]|uniref:Pycsar system effector family protein n=1 Tax=Actinoplanes sp. TBRC 11911 TaxID=2729386 RepID=UPI00145F7E42|nr:Pycsar system effector family protein [Actinoplanes sp. TBRC 11911]NMO56159.1 hypothetical protein [Actinoplanes sp. TBRC 11911]
MSADQDLQHDTSLALHTITETNQSIRFADTKAGALAGIQALMITILARRHESGDGTLLRLLYLACLLGILVSALLLAVGQVPRLLEDQGRMNRVSFTALSRMHPDQLLQVPPMDHRHEDAWRQAASLARIALAKFRWLTRAAASTVLTLAAVLAWQQAATLA